MPRTLHRPAPQAKLARQVSPSILDDVFVEPFTLEQELKPFGAWVDKPVWVPPKDASETFAETMLQETGPFVSKAERWEAVIQKHRSDFTQVREFDLFESSIRLPKGRFFVTVTQEKDFDKITDPIPNCVRTRLEEFQNGRNKDRIANVYYLKPLCVEIGDDLILTTREDLMAAISKVQDEVFAAYRKRAPYRRTMQAMVGAANLALALPRTLMQQAIARRQKAIEALHARLEFERRKLALNSAQAHRECRSHGCTFDEMLDLTTPVDRAEVIDQYCFENQLSSAKRAQLLRMAAGTALPWFVALSLTVSYMATVALAISTPPIVVCDPAFVAEMPGSRGVLLKIGHFDQVGGVTHVEL